MVASGAVAASARAGHSQLALVDGAVGIVFAPAGRLQLVLAFTVSGTRRITAIDVIADPDRLRRLRLAVLPDYERCGTKPATAGQARALLGHIDVGVDGCVVRGCVAGLREGVV